MRRYLCLLLLLSTLALAYSCQKVDQAGPSVQIGQPVSVVPEWKDQIQLIGRADEQMANCSADGKMLLVETDQGAELVENAEGKLRMVAVLQSESPILASALSADGKWVVAANTDSLTVYSTADGAQVSSVRLTQAVTWISLQISQDGMSVASLCAGWLTLYHGPNLSQRWSCQLKETKLDPLLLMSSNGLTLAVCGDSLNVFAPDGASPLWTTPSPGTALIGTLSADGVYLAVQMKTSDGSDQLQVYERWNADPAWSFDVTGTATCLRFSPDGEWLALSTDQFYLFRCSLDRPVMQSQQSGSASFANGQVLLIEQQSLYRLNPTEQNLVSFKLPPQLVGELSYFYSEQEWLFALNNEGILFLIRLPLAPDSTDV